MNREYDGLVEVVGEAVNLSTTLPLVPMKL